MKALLLLLVFVACASGKCPGTKKGPMYVIARGKAKVQVHEETVTKGLRVELVGNCKFKCVQRKDGQQTNITGSVQV